MAVIKTKEYVLDQSFVGRYMKQQSRGTLYIPAAAILVFCGMTYRGGFSPGFLATVLIVGVVWIYGFEKRVRNYPSQLADAGLFSVRRWKEIDDEYISSYDKEGTFTKNRIATLIRKVETYPEYYVLHLSTKPKGFDFIPFRAFESEADRQSFEQVLAKNRVMVVVART